MRIWNSKCFHGLWGVRLESFYLWAGGHSEMGLCSKLFVFSSFSRHSEMVESAMPLNKVNHVLPIFSLDCHFSVTIMYCMHGF